MYRFVSSILCGIFENLVINMSISVTELLFLLDLSFQTLILVMSIWIGHMSRCLCFLFNVTYTYTRTHICIFIFVFYNI